MNAKESLITTTQTLLWERGYVGVSPKDILDHSGVGHGSMYHHFTGKAELARAAIERSAENLRSQAERQLSVPGTAYDKLMAFLQREREILRGCQIGRLAQDPDIIGSEMLREVVESAFESVRQLLLNVVARGVQAGELNKNIAVSDTAELILSVLQGGYVLSRASRSEEPFRAAIRGLRTTLKSICVDKNEPIRPVSQRRSTKAETATRKSRSTKPLASQAAKEATGSRPANGRKPSSRGKTASGK